MGLRFNSRPLTPPIVDPRRKLATSATSYIYGSNGSMYLESLVPIVFGTFQSARNFGRWKACHFRTRISTCIYGTERVMTALFKAFQTWCAKRRSAVFCVRIAMWHTQHSTRPKGFETIGSHGFPGNMVWRHANLLDRKCLDAVSTSNNEITVRDTNKKQYKQSVLVLRWTSQIGSWILNCSLKGIGIK